MSVFTGSHPVVSYVSGVTVPVGPSQRLSKVLFKLDRETKVKRQNMAVSIPVISSDAILDAIDVLIPHFRGYLEGVQDSIVREIVVAGSGMVSDDDISMAAILEYLESSNESGRMTKESIGAWFSASMEVSLAAAFAEKLGVSEIPTDAESEKVMAAVSSYGSKFQMLAGGKTSFDPAVAVKLLGAMDSCGIGSDCSDGGIGAKFRVRLNKMVVAPSVEELLGL